MAAEKYVSRLFFAVLFFFHQHDCPAQAFAVPRRAAWRGRPVRTLQTKWQIETKNRETGGGERLRHFDQQLRLAVGPRAVREDDGVAAWPRRQMQESANGGFGSCIMKRRRHRLCDSGFASTNPETRKWWRRGESEYSWLLKTRKLLNFRHAKNAENCQIALNWNVSGTRDFHSLASFFRKISVLRRLRHPSKSS